MMRERERERESFMKEGHRKGVCGMKFDPRYNILAFQFFTFGISYLSRGGREGECV
jgi:hypothetical protein